MCYEPISFHEGPQESHIGGSQMSIAALVVDSTNPKRGRAMAVSLYISGIETYFYDGNMRVKAPEWQRRVNFPREVPLLLLHDKNQKIWEQLELKPKIIIRYTGGELPLHTAEEEFWIRKRSISSPKDTLLEHE